MRKRRPVVDLLIDGQQVKAFEGDSVLDAARRAGIEIPTLCHLDGLSEVGSCRLCVVEIAERRGLPPACATRVTPEMVVQTDTQRLRAHRRMVVEMLFAERNHVCSVCVANGNCELQDLAYDVGMDHVRLPYLFPACDADASHRDFIQDDNRCILCTRCVRVCDEIEGAHTWDVLGRGVNAQVITDLNQPWGESETCTGCGKCIHVCPTGALVEKGKSVQEMSKQRQFLPYLTLMRERRW